MNYIQIEQYMANEMEQAVADGVRVESGATGVILNDRTGIIEPMAGYGCCAIGCVVVGKRAVNVTDFDSDGAFDTFGALTGLSLTAMNDIAAGFDADPFNHLYNDRNFYTIGANLRKRFLTQTVY